MTPEPDTATDLFAVVRHWLQLLASGHSAAAAAALDEPNSYGIQWSAEAIAAAVDAAFPAGCQFRRSYPRGLAFSDPDKASGSPRGSAGKLNSGGYWVVYPVPLNGEWSDLSAEFEFHRRPGGLAMVLHDLHVL